MKAIPMHKETIYPARILIPILFLITVHSFFMNGFYNIHPYNNVGTYYASVLSHIDPSLFKNSIFVQAIERNGLRLSAFFDIFPYLSNICSFETFTVVQGFASTFFTIAGIYMLTVVFFKNSTAGCIAGLLYTVQLNNWTLGSPAPYLNFFHHGLPYTYPLMVWSLVFFFRKQYAIAVLLAGISWNFHPMCTAFLLIAYLFYLILNFKEFSFSKILSYLGIFIISAFPTTLKAISHMSSSSGVGQLWFKGVLWNAAYTCYPSSWPLNWICRALFFFILFLLCLTQIQDKRLKQKLIIFIIAVIGMCAVGTVFADVYPIPLVIKISFWRSTFIYLILALPCIAYTLYVLSTQAPVKCFFTIVFLTFLTGYLSQFNAYYFPFLLLPLGYALFEKQLLSKYKLPLYTFALILFCSLAIPICLQSIIRTIPFLVIAAVLFILSYTILTNYLQNQLGFRFSKQILLVFICITLFDVTAYYSQGTAKFFSYGNILGKTDPWVDFQIHSKKISDKNDLFIVPPYLNDFSVYSHRATLSDWAEGANILYLDNQFAEEWFERMNDLGWTERFNAREGFSKLSTKAIIKAANKYGARFVITEKPKTFSLPILYENSKYVLYQIR